MSKYEYSRKKYQLFFPGKNRNDSKQNDLIIICGAKGVGKTTLAKYLINLYHKYNPKDNVVVLSGVKETYDDLDFAKIIDLDEAARFEDEKSQNDWSGVPNPANYKNSLVIFDDCENYPHPKMNKILDRFANVLAQNGRNYSITIIIIIHHLNKGMKSSTILRELDALIIFPEKFDVNVYNTLLVHFGMPKDILNKIYGKRDKFIYIRNSAPFYYFGSSDFIPRKLK